jgi:hypothetical protein
VRTLALDVQSESLTSSSDRITIWSAQRAMLLASTSDGIRRVIRSTLQLIMNAELSDDAWNQATLPVACGGLQDSSCDGRRSTSLLSSVAGSHALITQLLPQRLHACRAQMIRPSQPQWLIGSLEWFLHRSNSLFRLFRRSGMDRL